MIRIVLEFNSNSRTIQSGRLINIIFYLIKTNFEIFLLTFTHFETFSEPHLDAEYRSLRRSVAMKCSAVSANVKRIKKVNVFLYL